MAEVELIEQIWRKVAKACWVREDRTIQPAGLFVIHHDLIAQRK